jgi:hypothetical protein
VFSVRQNINANKYNEMDFLNKNKNALACMNTYDLIYIKNQRDAAWQYVYY